MKGDLLVLWILSGACLAFAVATGSVPVGLGAVGCAVAIVFYRLGAAILEELEILTMLVDMRNGEVEGD